MFCTKCGQQLPEGSAFCSVCGAPQAVAAPQPTYQQPVYQQPAQPVYQQTVYQQPMYQQPLSRKEFYNQFVSKKSNSTVICMAVIFFITAAISIPLIVVLENMLGIMDIAVYTLFGILLLATKHWVCALIPTAYSAVGTIVSMVNGGAPTGIVALIVGATCVSLLQKFEKMYKAYTTTGVLPTAQL